VGLGLGESYLATVRQGYAPHYIWKALSDQREQRPLVTLLKVTSRDLMRFKITSNKNVAQVFFVIYSKKPEPNRPGHQ